MTTTEPILCPACEQPSVGKCRERADGEHPSWEVYNAEMAEVLTPAEYAAWREDDDTLKHLPIDRDRHDLA